MIWIDASRPWIALAALAAASLPAGGEPATPPAEPVFARVNGKAITVQRYDIELLRTARQKYYHRQPPQEQMTQLRREVGDALIDRALLVAEAARRGIEPDRKKVQEAIDAIEARNRGNPRWKQQRVRLLPEIRRDLSERSALERLEQAVRTVPPPGAKQVREYYDAHPEQFTEPEQLRLSVILLRVDPVATQVEREKAMEEAKATHERLMKGADFAALARERSGDASAKQGGDMGYVHRGMLAEALQAKVDGLSPGMLTEPTVVLEGIAILRLDERKPARLVGFEQSRERAAQARHLEDAEKRWNALKARLRAAARIEVVDASRYPSPKAAKK